MVQASLILQHIPIVLISLPIIVWVIVPVGIWILQIPSATRSTRSRHVKTLFNVLSKASLASTESSSSSRPSSHWFRFGCTDLAEQSTYINTKKAKQLVVLSLWQTEWIQIVYIVTYRSPIVKEYLKANKKRHLQDVKVVKQDSSLKDAARLRFGSKHIRFEGPRVHTVGIAMRGADIPP